MSALRLNLVLRTPNADACVRRVRVELMIFKDLPPSVAVIVVCFVITFTTEFTSNTATCTIAMPVLSSLSQSMMINPMTLLVPGKFDWRLVAAHRTRIARRVSILDYRFECVPCARRHDCSVLCVYAARGHCSQRDRIRWRRARGA